MPEIQWDIRREGSAWLLSYQFAFRFPRHWCQQLREMNLPIVFGK